MRSHRIAALPLLALVAACGQDAVAPIEPLEPLASVAAASGSAAACTQLRGTVQARFLTGAEQEALPPLADGAVIGGTLFDDRGVAIGDAYAWIDDLVPRGNGALHIEMRHRYVIGGEAFDTEDTGTLSPVDPPLYRFNNRLTVAGGTGGFAGATGLILAHGTVVIGGDIALQYHGRLCP
jgi:hypothetical protein